MKGIVYVLIIGDSYYIGSTTQSLNKRLAHHKSNAKRMATHYANLIKDVNYNILIDTIDEFEVSSLKELLLIEKEYIELYKEYVPLLNKINPITSPEEKKIHQQIYHKEYRALLSSMKPKRIFKKDNPDYNKNRWLEWANKNRTMLRENYKKYKTP